MAGQAWELSIKAYLFICFSNIKIAKCLHFCILCFYFKTAEFWFNA